MIRLASAVAVLIFTMVVVLATFPTNAAAQSMGDGERQRLTFPVLPAG